MFLCTDNLNALNPKVADALGSLNPAPLQELARRSDEAGAEFIDINPGHLPAHKRDRVVFMVDAVQEVSNARLIIDSPDPAIVELGVRACEDRPVINGISGERHKLETIVPLAAETGSQLVVLLMDERSFVPPICHERIALATELAQAAQAYRIPLQDMIFDPVLPNMTWSDAHARIAAAVSTVRLLSTGAVFQQQVHTMVGLSNVRSGLRRVYPFHMDEICLNLFAGAGVSHVLCDILQQGMLDAFQQCQAVVGAEG